MQIKANVLGYIIGEVISQMILDYPDQLFSDLVTHKNIDQISS